MNKPLQPTPVDRLHDPAPFRMNSLHVTFFGIALSATVAYAADPSPRTDVKTITNSIGMKLIRIESGSFPMGSPV
ncbi:MAG: hypothetical protein VB878_06245, partial [Pirellulaceae bacterium]